MASPTPRGYSPRAKRRKVSVEQTSIDRAKVSDSKHCAIAQSIAASIPDASHIMVDIASIRFTHDGGTKRSYYLTPAEVQKFILKFDLGTKVEPFDFQLREGVVHDVKRRPGVGGRPKGTSIASSHRTPPRVTSSKRRTYGARSMTQMPIAKKAIHADT